MTTRGQIFLAGALVAGALGATLLLGDDGSPAAGAAGGHDHSAMGGSGEAAPVRIGDDLRRRIGVTFAEATAGPLRREVRAVGTVTYDERRLVSLNPKIDGWVERLFVDFTGAEVRKGQPMLTVYSPDLVSAQEELLLARRLVDRTSDAPDSRAAANARELLASTRRRLAYWDVPGDEVRRIEASGRADKALVLRAPASGVVVEKHAQEGARIVPGAPLYHIADLSTVWVEAEVFEKDLSLLRVGQRGRVTFEAYPGETFEGRVTYVYPTVSLEARTGRIRLELPNPDERLKPGMYADVAMEVPAGGSRVSVPRSAVLATGRRSVVFVRDRDGTLVPTEVRTGLAAGDRMEILSGVEAGDTVVSSAAFLIDAESSLGAAMSAMARDSGGSGGQGGAPGAPAGGSATGGHGEAAGGTDAGHAPGSPRADRGTGTAGSASHAGH